MSHCIAVYLKAPVKVGTNVEKARICPQVVDRHGLATEADFAPYARELNPRDHIDFNLTQFDGISGLYQVAGPWLSGCRVSPKLLLGDKGDTFSANLGLDYDVTNRQPCKFMSGSFTGSGVLSLDDQAGTTFVVDLSKDAGSYIYMVVAEESGDCDVELNFTNSNLGNFVLPQTSSAWLKRVAARHKIQQAQSRP